MTRIDWHESELDAVPSRDFVRDGLVERSAPVVLRLQEAAPKKTGRSAASIQAQAVRDWAQWTVHVSWEARYFFLNIYVEGDRRQPSRNFVRTAVEGL